MATIKISKALQVLKDLVAKIAANWLSRQPGWVAFYLDPEVKCREICWLKFYRDEMHRDACRRSGIPVTLPGLGVDQTPPPGSC